MEKRHERVGVLRLGEPARAMAPHQVAQNRIPPGQHSPRPGVVDGQGH